MKLNTTLIGAFVLTILIISTFAYISAILDNQKNLEIFENHINVHGEIHNDELLQIKRDMNSKLTTILIVFTIISLIVSIFAGILINNLIGKPIQRVSKTVDEVSKGNLDIEIDKKILDSKNEIGDLARSLTRVLASLKLAVLRKKPVKKGNFDREKTGISENDLAKSGLLSKPIKETNKSTSTKSNIAVIKKPLVTFPDIKGKKDKKELEKKG